MLDCIPHDRYLHSQIWLSRHSRWLKQANQRCMMFPWIRVGKVRGRYFRYHCHHTHYQAGYQGTERFGVDVLVLSPIAHRLIHRVLGGADRVRDQKSQYPNRAQRLAHAWCRVPAPLKSAIALCATISFGCLFVLGGLYAVI